MTMSHFFIKKIHLKFNFKFNTLIDFDILLYGNYHSICRQHWFFTIVSAEILKLNNLKNVGKEHAMWQKGWNNMYIDI